MSAAESAAPRTKAELLAHLAEAHGLHLDRPATMEVLKVIHRGQHGPSSQQDNSDHGAEEIDPWVQDELDRMD